VSGPTDNEWNSNSSLFRREFQLPDEDPCRDDWVHFFGGDDLPLARFLSNTVHPGSQLVLMDFSFLRTMHETGESSFYSPNRALWATGPPLLSAGQVVF